MMNNDWIDDYLIHRNYKYIDKYKSKTGKWIYVYKDKMKNGSLGKKVNKTYNKVFDVYNGLMRNNPYDTDSTDYARKIKAIENTKEWQEIVARRDPEYVSRDKNGKDVYRIDDYLVKKKHPVLDVMDDVGNGRDLSINELNVNALVTGLNDYVKTEILAMGLAAKFATEKIKLHQGSYDKQIDGVTATVGDVTAKVDFASNQLNKTVNSGKQFIDDLVKYYREG